jgi:hypothetical protein
LHFGRPDTAVARRHGLRDDISPDYQLRNRGNRARIEPASALVSEVAREIGTRDDDRMAEMRKRMLAAAR